MLRMFFVLVAAYWIGRLFWWLVHPLLTAVT
jgi:hypothetical protein